MTDLPCLVSTELLLNLNPRFTMLSVLQQKQYDEFLFELQCAKFEGSIPFLFEYSGLLNS